MKDTERTIASPATPQGTSAPTEATLQAFRTLSLPEKAMTIAQTQAMLFSNTVLRALSSAFRRQPPGGPTA